MNINIIINLCRLQSCYCGTGGEAEQRNVGADKREAQRVHDGRIAISGRFDDTGRDGRGAQRQRATVPGQGAFAAVTARRGPSKVPVVLGPVGVCAHRPDRHIGETILILIIKYYVHQCCDCGAIF